MNAGLKPSEHCMLFFILSYGAPWNILEISSLISQVPKVIGLEAQALTFTQ